MTISYKRTEFVLFSTYWFSYLFWWYSFNGPVLLVLWKCIRDPMKKVIVATIKQEIAFDFCFRCISSIFQMVNVMLKRINTYGKRIEICAKRLNRARIKAIADNMIRIFVNMEASLLGRDSYREKIIIATIKVNKPEKKESVLFTFWCFCFSSALMMKVIIDKAISI